VLLSDDIDRHRQIFAGLDRAEAEKGYPALVTAAFGIAADWRFGTSYEPADIVAFVAEVRARLPRVRPCLCSSSSRARMPGR
jgi:hypothetical protein